MSLMCLFVEAMWSSLLPVFVRLTRDDFLWRRLLSALLTGISDHCLESTVVPLVKLAPWSVCNLILMGGGEHLTDVLVCFTGL